MASSDFALGWAWQTKLSCLRRIVEAFLETYYYWIRPLNEHGSSTCEDVRTGHARTIPATGNFTSCQILYSCGRRIDITAPSRRATAIILAYCDSNRSRDRRSVGEGRV